MKNLTLKIGREAPVRVDSFAHASKVWDVAKLGLIRPQELVREEMIELVA